MARKKTDNGTAETTTAETSTRKARTPAPKTERLLQLERDLAAEKVSAKELAWLKDGSKIALRLNGLTKAGKDRVMAIMFPLAGLEGERPTDTSYQQPGGTTE